LKEIPEMYSNKRLRRAELRDASSGDVELGQEEPGVERYQQQLCISLTAVEKILTVHVEELNISKV